MARPDPLLWERWAEVDHLLGEALERPAGERETFVAERTEDDPPLRALVLRLLRHLPTDTDLDLGPGSDVVLAAFGTGADIDDLGPGAEVGRYRIVGLLGRGGMATVYDAERADGVYRQRVALKVLRRGLDTDDLIRRFVTERQILSSLTHPNIGRLVDGGSTASGRPYLVMELVTGEAITAWADRQRLEVAARLRLFLSVADAVHAAHRRLVVHRDIKPSNILVDAEGRVKLLDFGIAKLLDAPAEHTDVGLRAHTPAYASPEQIAGGQVTTATDVYQLGLLLRELLTGVRPATDQSRPGEPPLGLARTVALSLRSGPAPEERARLRATTPARLARRLRGDLDVIVGKALRLEPEDRYLSADQLAGDVRRHLRGMPIAAHPESATYRARKFMTRHRMFLPAVAVATVVAVGYMATLVRHNHRLERERDLAEAASRRAQETQAFFVSLLRSADPFSPADPERGRRITVVEAIDLGAERVRRELEGQPELRAALLSAIGAVLFNLDHVESADSVINEAMVARARRGDTTSTGYADDLLILGRLLSAAGKHDTARTVLDRMVALERARIPQRPEALADGLKTLALEVAWFGPEESPPLTEEAVRILRPVGSVPLALALRALADAYRGVGRQEEAEAAAREALALLESLESPSSAEVGLATHTLGQILVKRGRTEEAAAYMRRSIGIFDERLGPDHTFTVTMRNNLGVLLINAESYPEAETVLREVLASRLSAYGPDHPLVAGTWQNLAVAVAGEGRLEEAESFTRKAEDAYRRGMPPGSFHPALPMLTRAEIQLEQGKAAAAARSAAGAAALLAGKVPVVAPPAIMADCRLGRARAMLGDRRAARVLLDSAIRRLETAEGIRDSHRAECLEARAALAGD